MPRKIRLTTAEEIQQIFSEQLVNKTNKVTKVSPNSGLYGIGYGVSGVAQKSVKDIALLESNIFPDYANDGQLDNIAENYGISARFGATRSSTYVRVFAEQGTQYVDGTHTFQTSSGLTFEPEQDVTVGISGIAYIKVRSQDTGRNQNVEALAINQVSPTPVGHEAVFNEFQAIGGRDNESDERFRKRIKEGANILAKGTLASIEQAFIKANNEVLSVNYNGINELGKIVLAVASVNGIDFTDSELENLLNVAGNNLSITELQSPFSESYNVKLVNQEYQPIDLDFRVELNQGFNPDSVRKAIQTRLSKFFRNEKNFLRNKVQWDDLLGLVKRTNGVKYVPDQNFNPDNDIPISPVKQPRVRGFLMRNLSGSIIQDVSGILQPVYYQNSPDVNFQETVVA